MPDAPRGKQWTCGDGRRSPFDGVCFLWSLGKINTIE